MRFQGVYFLDLVQIRIIRDDGPAGAVAILIQARRKSGPWRLEISDGQGLRLRGADLPTLDAGYAALRDLEQRSPILLRDLQAWATEGGRP